MFKLCILVQLAMLQLGEVDSEICMGRRRGRVFSDCPALSYPPSMCEWIRCRLFIVNKLKITFKYWKNIVIPISEFVK